MDRKKEILAKLEQIQEQAQLTLDELAIDVGVAAANNNEQQHGQSAGRAEIEN